MAVHTGFLVSQSVLCSGFHDVFSQPWTNVSATDNFVLCQSPQPGDTVSRVNPSSPNTCLVAATSMSDPGMSIGLGSVSNCRVAHFSSADVTSSSVWSDESWASYSVSSPHGADDSLNLVIRTPTLAPGASKTFGWVYTFDVSGSPVVNALTSVYIQQPADTATGSSCVFSAVANSSAASVSFTLLYQSTVVVPLGVATTPVFTFSSGLALFSVTYDTTTLTPSDGYTVSQPIAVVCCGCMIT